MVKHLIKICGIKDRDTATAAVKAGADYIGLIFHPESPRHVELKVAIKIAQAIHFAGAIPVAVFVNQTDIEMRSICEATQIKCVQLHGSLAQKNHHFLPDDYQRFYVQTELKNDDDHLHYLDKDRDFILIDQARSGQDPTTKWKKSSYSPSFRWFLAGGLTPINVQHALSILQPNGVDVSSGVESSVGNKDMALIQQFIATVENHDAI